MFKIITDCVYADSCYIKVSGLDLYSPTNVLIPAHDKILVDVELPFRFLWATMDG